VAHGIPADLSQVPWTGWVRTLERAIVRGIA